MLIRKKIIDFNNDLHSSLDNITSSLQENITQNIGILTKNLEKNNSSDLNDKQYALLDDCPPTPIFTNDDNESKSSNIQNSEERVEGENDEKKAYNESLMILARRSCPEGRRRKNRASLRPAYDRTKSEPRLRTGNSSFQRRGKNNCEKKPSIRRNRSGCEDDRFINANQQRRVTRNTSYNRSKRKDNREEPSLTSKRNDRGIGKKDVRRNSSDSKSRSKPEMYPRRADDNNLEPNPKKYERRTNKKDEVRSKSTSHRRPSYSRTKSESLLSFDIDSSGKSNRLITRHRSSDTDIIKMRSNREREIGKKNESKNSFDSKSRSKSDMYPRRADDSTIEPTPKKDERRINKKKRIARSKSSSDDRPSYSRSQSESRLSFDIERSGKSNKAITTYRSGDGDIKKTRTIRERENGKKNERQNFLDSKSRSKSDMYPRRAGDSIVEPILKKDERRTKKKNEVRSSRPSCSRTKSESRLSFDIDSSVKTNKSITRHRSGNIEVIKLRNIRSMRKKHCDLEKNRCKLETFERKSTGTKRREQLIRSSSMRQRHNSKIV